MEEAAKSLEETLMSILPMMLMVAVVLSILIGVISAISHKSGDKEGEEREVEVGEVRSTELESEIELIKSQQKKSLRFRFKS